MTEAALWTTTRGALSPYGRLVRVENPATPGTPDVYYSFPGGRRGWIELKHLDEWPARFDTPIRIPHLTLDQVMWMEEEVRMGGRAFLLLQVEQCYMLVLPKHARLIFDCQMVKEDVLDRALIAARGQFPALGVVQLLRTINPIDAP